MGSIRNLLPILGVSISLSASAIVLSWLLFLLTGNASYFVISLLAVTISSFYGGVKAGLATVVITTLAIDYIFIDPIFSITIAKVSSLVELLIFSFVGTSINIIFDKIRNTKDILGYKQRQKEHLAVIAELQTQIITQQKEIKSRDEFLSIASHELKTPLSAMLLQIQTALYNIRNVSLANFSVEKLLKMLQSTEQQTKRLSKMINDLLNISLITTDRFDLEKEKIDLSHLTKEVIDRFAERAEREGSPIKLQTEKDVIGNWDKLRIEQAITNLITNAMKYGGNKPITIVVGHANGMGTIKVSDHGIGIPADRQKRIFERFERGVSNHSYKGLGVGLYITQHIVQTHEGKITLQSKPNTGSTFTISLPLAQESKQTTPVSQTAAV